jgi:hypothetical protein
MSDPASELQRAVRDEMARLEEQLRDLAAQGKEAATAQQRQDEVTES